VQVNKDVLVCFTQVVSNSTFRREATCLSRPTKVACKKDLDKGLCIVCFFAVWDHAHIFRRHTFFVFACAETNQEVLVCFTEVVSFLSRLTKVTGKKDLDKGPCIVCYFAV
jgi:hypothetical protein